MGVDRLAFLFGCKFWEYSYIIFGCKFGSIPISYLDASS